MTNDHPTPFHSYCVAITRVSRFSVTLQLLSYSCPPCLFVYMVAANTTVPSELLSNITYQKNFKQKSRFARSNLEQPLLYENVPIRNFNIRKLLHAKISQTTVMFQEGSCQKSLKMKNYKSDDSTTGTY